MDQSGNGSQYFPQKLKVTRVFEYGPLLDMIEYMKYCMLRIEGSRLKGALLNLFLSMKISGGNNWKLLRLNFDNLIQTVDERFDPIHKALFLCQV